MDDKLTEWAERISKAPVDSKEYEEFLERLAECRIIEECAV